MSYTSIRCPHCHAEHVSARIVSGGQLPNEDGEARYFFVAACSGCSFPSIIVARRSGTRIADGRKLIKHVCWTERDPIPNFIETINMIPSNGVATILDGLPENIASAFAEARDSLRRGAVNSAAMAFRLTLERATRSLHGDIGKTLTERIAELVGKHALPSALGKWSAEIDLIQSQLIEQDTNPTAAQLRDADCFTEIFLTCAFTLPARIALHHASDPVAEPADRGTTDDQTQQSPVPRPPGQSRAPAVATRGF